jgi:hypothetical protein
MNFANPISTSAANSLIVGASKNRHFWRILQRNLLIFLGMFLKNKGFRSALGRLIKSGLDWIAFGFACNPDFFH